MASILQKAKDRWNGEDGEGPALSSEMRGTFSRLKQSKGSIVLLIVLPLVAVFSVVFLFSIGDLKRCIELYAPFLTVGLIHLLLTIVFIFYVFLRQYLKAREVDRSLYNIWNEDDAISSGSSFNPRESLSSGSEEEEEAVDLDAFVPFEDFRHQDDMHMMPEADGGGQKTKKKVNLNVFNKNFYRKRNLNKLFSRGCILNCAFGWIVCGLTAFMAVVLIIQFYMVNATTPKIQGEIHFGSKIQSKDGIKIVRDENGMIHVTASTEYDLYFGQGIAGAQDRLFQMDLHRRLGKGTLSEIVGSAGVAMDSYFKTLGILESANAVYANLEEEARFSLLAYVDGCNYYLGLPNTHRSLEFRALEYKPEPFEAVDVIVWSKIMALELSMNMHEEIKRYNILWDKKTSPERILQMWPAYPKDSPTILTESEMDPVSLFNGTEMQNAQKEREEGRKEEFERINMFMNKNQRKRSSEQIEEGKGIFQDWLDRRGKRNSNNWVISSKLSSTGKPLLSSDPHLGLSSPSVWLMMSLNGPNISLVGSTFPGVPGVVIGRNSWISWGVTNAQPDTQDFYIIEPHDTIPNAYWANGQVHHFTERNERIYVKGGKTHFFTVKETIYGPIMNDVLTIKGHYQLALRWTAVRPEDRTVNAVARLQKASNFDEFREALKSWDSPAQNFVYSDIYGNIGYQCPGIIPIRKPSHSGLFPVNSNASLDWVGFIPFEHLPWTLNPAKGYIASANNKITPSSYRYIILADEDWEEPQRFTRIVEMIEEGTKNNRKLSVDDMKRMQNDYVSLIHRDFMPLLQSLSVSSGSSKYRSQLLDWNGDMSPSSQLATLFQYWYIQLMQVTLEETGQKFWNKPLFLRTAFSTSACSSKGLDCHNYALNAFELAVQKYEKEGKKKWGDVHKTLFDHPLFKDVWIDCLYRRKVGTGGDWFTPNVSPYNFETFQSTFGPSYRQVLEMDSSPMTSSNVPPFHYILPLGQSESPFSKFYDNWLDDWKEGDYEKVPSSPEEYRKLIIKNDEE